jgi:YVTN family beta-propeller protein
MVTVDPMVRSLLVALVVLSACTTAGSTAVTTTVPTATVAAPASTVPAPPPTTTTSTTTTTTLPPTTTTTTTTTLVPADGLAAADRSLVEVATITGGISPKSVVTSGNGLFFAQNMMYRHTVTVYDRDHELVATIPDHIVLSDFGHGDFPGEYRGSPVEAAFTSDGTVAYVSNYRMYGGGLSTAASDGCDAGNWPDSFVYRIDTSTFEIDQAIRVGPVPKFLAVTPDDRFLVVANWCGFDVSIVDTATGVEVTRVPVGRHPRGIAVSPNSDVAYVAVMGSRRLAVIDLETFAVDTIEDVGRSPRHLVVSPDGVTLYISLNGDGRLAKLDLATREVVATVATGQAPRSMAISDDGTALYVVNYFSNTMSKVRTSDMVETEEHGTWSKPIGITYDAPTREVWVSSYSGAIEVFADMAP